jgi:hypothetical protein
VPTLRPLLLLAALGCPSACAVAQVAWSPGPSSGRYAPSLTSPSRDDFAGVNRAAPPASFRGPQPGPPAGWDGHAGPLGHTVERTSHTAFGPADPDGSSGALGRDWPPLDGRAGPTRHVQYEDQQPLPEPVFGPPPPAVETFPPRGPGLDPVEPYGPWGAQNPENMSPHEAECRTWNCDCDACCDGNAWTWQLLPKGLLYRAYLAGPKESRLAAVWVHDGEEWLFDGTLGGHFGLLRYGTVGGRNAEGYQLGLEASAQLRMNWTRDLDMDATDYVFGIPLTHAEGPWEWRFGYFHLSSHTGDEYLVRNTTLIRENYVRDSLNLGLAYFVTDALRVYGEASFAFRDYAGAKPWHFQFGFDYSPVVFGPDGAPFVAVNVSLREEIDYGGGVNFETGWQWQQPHSEQLFRIGLRYYNGQSTQYSFFREHQQLIGAGIWYDY